MRNAASDRVWFLDNVRYWSVLAVVLLHVGISQIRIPWGWAVDDPRRRAEAEWLTIVTGSFVMPVLFFVAGYFALPSLGPKGPWLFLWAKVKRLVIPGALVIIFLNPVFRYIYFYTRDFDEAIPRMSYWEYWPRFFDGMMSIVVWVPTTPWVVEYTPIHIWFVTVLFWFFVLTAVCVAAFPSLARPIPHKDLSPVSTKLLIGVLLTATLIAWAGSFAVSSLWKPCFVMIGPLLGCFVPDMPYHTLYYLLGIAAFRRGWFRTPGALGPVWWWGMACVLLSVGMCYLQGMQVSDESLRTNSAFNAVSGLGNGLLCMGFLGFLLMFAQKYFDRPSQFHQHMASESYRTYLLHLTVVVLVQFALLRWSSLSGLSVLVLGCVLSLLGSHLAAYVTGRMVAFGGMSGRRMLESAQGELEAG